MRRKKIVLPVTNDPFDKMATENRTDLSGRRLKRFLDEAHSLRRNLELRKKQQLAKGKK